MDTCSRLPSRRPGIRGVSMPAIAMFIVAWIEIHSDELLADWNLAVAGEKPFPIRGLE
jgi:hypothetical protein